MSPLPAPNFSPDLSLRDGGGQTELLLCFPPVSVTPSFFSLVTHSFWKTHCWKETRGLGNVAKNARPFSLISAKAAGVIFSALVSGFPSLGLMLHACSHQIVRQSAGICPRDLLNTCKTYELVFAIFRG